MVIQALRSVPTDARERLDLDSIAVRPGFQGHGCGSRLMSAVIEEAKKGGHNIALCASEGEAPIGFFLACVS
jgi:GNAT superfamily N-acetyltransferase